MTTEAQIEAIARAYCVNLGLDPDEWMPWHYEDTWQHFACKAREALAMRDAIDEVMGDREGGA